MNVVLVSTYELGRQPFGLASPAAWLKRDGHQVSCVDLAVEAFPEARFQEADLVAFYLPMHTATRLAIPAIERVQRLRPGVRLVCYGLYAAINAGLLRELGVEATIGGEFEAQLVKLARGETAAPVSLEKLTFLTPDRAGLPDLGRYAKLRVIPGTSGETRTVAYTEASRGCKHLCRHCPVTPVYQGHFRVVGRQVVLDDIRRQVAAGARHVTFGDPDFFNGPKHAIAIVKALHAEFPEIGYDATIKIEHLRKHRELLRPLKDTGCLFVTSAVESVDDAVLAKLDKRHTNRDFIEAAVEMREIGLNLSPTFIAFTPWTTAQGYRDLLRVIAELDLIECVAPIQLALRLLVTSGSRLLELPDVQARLSEFDRRALVYPWTHPDPAVDLLADRVFRLVQEQQERGCSRAAIFASLWRLANDQQKPPENYRLVPRAAIPYLDEPWYC